MLTATTKVIFFFFHMCYQLRYRKEVKNDNYNGRSVIKSKNKLSHAYFCWSLWKVICSYE